MWSITPACILFIFFFIVSFQCQVYIQIMLKFRHTNTAKNPSFLCKIPLEVFHLQIWYPHSAMNDQLHFHAYFLTGSAVSIELQSKEKGIVPLFFHSMTSISKLSNHLHRYVCSIIFGLEPFSLPTGSLKKQTWRKKYQESWDENWVFNMALYNTALSTCRLNQVTRPLDPTPYILFILLLLFIHPLL